MARPSGTRPILIVLGAALLSVTLCCGGCGLFSFLAVKRGQAEDAEAKVFARKALQSAGNWDPANLKPYLAPTWTQNVDPKKEAAQFAEFDKRFGPIRELGEFTSTSFFFGNKNGGPSGTRISMNASAKFAKAEGRITLGMAKLDGRWGIESLRIAPSSQR